MKYTYLLTLLLALFFLGCEKEEYQVDATLKDHTANLVHTWSLVRVIQVDGKAGPGKLKQLDISDAVLASGPSQLVFSNGQYTATGFISELFGTSGTWALDNKEFPSAISIDNADGARLVALGKSILPFSNTLTIKNDVRSCVDNSLTTSYQYVFEKN